MNEAASKGRNDEGEIVCSLADILHSSGISLATLARRTGKNRATLHRWLKNDVQDFDFDTWRRLCAVFVVSTEEGNMQPLPAEIILTYEKQEIRRLSGKKPDIERVKSSTGTIIPRRSIPVVTALEKLPVPIGRISCHLHQVMQEERIPTYRDLSELLEIRPETLSELAHNQTRSISRRVLIQLCKQFGGNVGRLFVYESSAE